MRIWIHDLTEIPLFNEDVERAAIPSAVASLREAVAEADGFLLATPEYNHGVPGVMAVECMAEICATCRR